MKKLICITLSLLILSGCTSTMQDSQTETTTAETTAAVADSSEESEFTRDDFVLFCRGSQEKEAVIWLGMTKEYVEEYTQKYPEYYQGFNDIEYETENEIEDNKKTENTIDYISLISYIGSSEYIETSKGIRTSGLDNVSSTPNSTADEVIKAYGLNPENENIYIGNSNEDNYTIAIYFNIDENNNVTRITVPRDTDNSSLEAVNADFFIKFMITQNEVSGLQMYRKSRTSVKEEE